MILLFLPLLLGNCQAVVMTANKYRGLQLSKDSWYHKAMKDIANVKDTIGCGAMCSANNRMDGR